MLIWELGDDSVRRVLVIQHKDLSSDPQHPQKKLNVCAERGDAVIPALGKWTQKDP